MPSLGTIIIGIILIAVVALVVRYQWKIRKTGGCSACPGGCAGCGHDGGHCSSKENDV
ncbi:MAG: FeoB-associated Cys-rich membrane protein [Oscillospiraceae bacterium]|nr:FeoB-associated Cys-rich membrane protein [Oscillospiraceae bacterium]